MRTPSGRKSSGGRSGRLLSTRAATLAGIALAALACSPPPSGPPALEVGFPWHDGYRALQAGDVCPVVEAPQGGTWTMPTVRARGLSSPALVRCALTLDEGEVAGSAEGRVPLLEGEGGWLEAAGFPIPVHHAPPRELEPISDWYGRSAELSCEAVDDHGGQASAATDVVIVEG